MGEGLRKNERLTQGDCMKKLKAWFIAGRFFVIPIFLVPFTFFGVALADFNLHAWAVAMLVIGSVWISAHFMNDWRDYALGVDSLKGGSVAKVYTAASQVLPRGLLSVRTIQLSALAFLLTSLLAFLLLVPLRIDTVLSYCFGVVMALTYTDYIKPKRGCEIWWGLIFFCLVFFSCCVASPMNFTTIAAATTVTMVGLMLHPLDQYPDLKEPIGEVNNLGELLFKAKIKLSGVFWFLVTAMFTMQMGFILLTWLPIGTLISLFSLPLAHITGVFIDYDLKKGMPLFLLWSAIYPTLAGLGALLC